MCITSALCLLFFTYTCASSVPPSSGSRSPTQFSSPPKELIKPTDREALSETDAKDVGADDSGKLVPPTPVKSQDKMGRPEIEAAVDIDAMDTMREPKGNWLLKRYWLQKAEQLYEWILQQAKKSLDLRLSFDTHRNRLDRDLFIPFYRSIGVTRGELMEIIASLISRLEEERVEKGQLSVDEREFLELLEKEKHALDQLQQNLIALAELDNAIDEATIKLAEQLNLSRTYQQQAWNSLQAIKRELSDKEARELYYSMDALAKNVNDIYHYVTEQFTSYFDRLVLQAKEQVSQITQSVEMLKKKGLDLKKELKAITLREMEKEEIEIKEKAEAAKKDREKEKISGWFSSFIKSASDWLSSFFKKAESRQ